MTEDINYQLLPPAYFQICLLFEIVLHFLFPVVRIIGKSLNYFGFLLILLGLGLNIWTDILFKKRKTTVKPFEKPSVLITHGPFFISRHPMYLGFVLILLGLAIVLGSLISFIGPVAMFFILAKLFISKEEKSLEKIFGKQYREYKSRVRRWF
ncbi:MAG: isoprenylcysteine carboxylmethyltransferase family protein [Candidatus Pacebacteria bacterium]|nr:isoprenylcysteine carboxylmethyltransferase family protein [Candidatus Paceibacterota bacterium]